jgi:hypothetical protein
MNDDHPTICDNFTFSAVPSNPYSDQDLVYYENCVLQGRELSALLSSALKGVMMHKAGRRDCGWTFTITDKSNLRSLRLAGQRIRAYDKTRLARLVREVRREVEARLVGLPTSLADLWQVAAQPIIPGNLAVTHITESISHVTVSERSRSQSGRDDPTGCYLPDLCVLLESTTAVGKNLFHPDTKP